ncbi:GNAT family N-acetyltransferase [Lutibacter sp.]|uniref:GNAT family N-acetyltransferase n=1 Tax=Lutibacter sp. TaxID=1925666 RepID=UPI0027361CB3|nr:GNAT family N-acetyltransferase [Lutibacter sp.]MDP3312914.1 GNAT family N-acetyltransferase [Lutibacter sp.]
MIYNFFLDNQFLIRTASSGDAVQMEFVQAQCYSTLHESEILDRNHFLNHIKVFPEGQIVIEKEGKIIASASTFRCNFPEHDSTFLEETDNLWITNVQIPDGDWMYGIDMGVLPEYRGLGLSTEMYKARTEVCRKLGLKGQIIAGMTIGYGKLKDKMTIEEYCEALINNKLTDPTITPQRKAGFRWIRPLYDYINDPEAGFASILMYLPVDENYSI